MKNFQNWRPLQSLAPFLRAFAMSDLSRRFASPQGQTFLKLFLNAVLAKLCKSHSILKIFMKIAIKVYPNSKLEKVIKKDDGSFEVRVKAPAQEGKANKVVIELLAEYFNVPKNSVFIKIGHSVKNKIVEIV